MEIEKKTKDIVDSKSTTDHLPRVTSKTRTSTAWLLIVSFILGLALLLIFILQNLGDISIQFFNLHWNIPLGIAMLLAVVAGGLLVASFGTARVVQLGRRLHQNKKIVSDKRIN